MLNQNHHDNAGNKQRSDFMLLHLLLLGYYYSYYYSYKGTTTTATIFLIVNFSNSLPSFTYRLLIRNLLGYYINNIWCCLAGAFKFEQYPLGSIICSIQLLAHLFYL